MKTKYNSFLKIFILSLLFISCSNDDEDTNNSETPLYIKSITEEIYYSSTSSSINITNFIYENNKLIKSINQQDGSYANIYYDGEKVTKIDNLSADNILNDSSTFFYEGDFLSKVEFDSGSENYRLYYQNGKLIKSEYGAINNSVYQIGLSREYTYENSNITQVINNEVNNGTIYTSKNIFTYDNKNNPIKYMNKYLKLNYSNEVLNGLSENNKLTQDSYYPITNTIPSKFIYQYVYNSDNYPTNIKRLTHSGTLISNTTIEYQSN